MSQTIRGLNDKIWETKNTAQRKVDQLEGLITSIEHTIKFYNRTGVFLMSYEDWYAAFQAISSNPFTEFKEQARKDNRPFVMAMTNALHTSGVAFSHGWNTHALVFRNSRELRPLAAPLLPLAETVFNWAAAQSGRHVLTMRGDTPALCRFHFNNKELFDEYLISFTTDIEKQIVMNTYHPT